MNHNYVLYNATSLSGVLYIWTHLNLQEILITFHNVVNAAIYPVSCWVCLLWPLWCLRLYSLIKNSVFHTIIPFRFDTVRFYLLCQIYLSLCISLVGTFLLFLLRVFITNLFKQAEAQQMYLISHLLCFQRLFFELV